MAGKIADLIFVYNFLKRLVTPFNETKAYQLGIIDERGKKIRNPQTSAELNAFSTFERLIFNIKKIIERAPGGKSKLASYAAALFLIKEHKNPKEEYSEKELIEALERNMEELKLTEEKQPKTFKQMSEKEFGDMLFSKELAVRDVSEGLKITHMVLDPDGKVLGTSSSEKHANDMAKNNLRKVKGKVVKLKKPMSPNRADRLIGHLPADNLGEDAPANATGAAVAGTGDDGVHWKKPDARKKEVKQYLKGYMERRKKRQEAKNRAEMRKLMGI
tara:strand:+ start:709 stop:1530 length:822 start_codon:yes stop_codon:yes gene_type:complete